MQERGRYIVVEGLEGSGKSTAVTAIQRFLSEHHQKVLLVREPGGTVVGESLRHLFKTEPMDARTELLLMYAARIELFENVISPALARGEWVVADRFELSSYAYQVRGRGVSEHLFQVLSKECLRDCKPDLIFFLDIPPEIGLKRAKGRGALDRIEQESIEFFKRVQNGYLEAIHKIKEAHVIQAKEPLRVVAKKIQSVLNEFIHE